MPAPLITRADCVCADEADPLAPFRDEFELPDGVIYLDGNSLGAKPKVASTRAAAVVNEEWGAGLIRSWNAAGWFDLPGRLGDLLARVIGGGAGETVVTDTTSTNLFKALAAALRVQAADAPERRVILSERGNFPTDLYLAQGLIEFVDRGYELAYVDDHPGAEAGDLTRAISDDVAVLLLSHVNYRTGAMWDLPTVTAEAHRKGAPVIWDLAHSAGAVPVDLTAADADYAVGCTYKYLNGGPGSPGFIWVAQRLQDRFWQPLSGWWGHARPFAMEAGYQPAAGIGRFLCGTPPIASLALVECGLDITLRADVDALRRKSLALGDLFLTLVEQRCAALTLVTPRDHSRRGSQLSFRHPEGFAVMQALIERGVIGDYREPEVLRFGITPLYLSHTDIWDAVEILVDILASAVWDQESDGRRPAVT